MGSSHAKHQIRRLDLALAKARGPVQVQVGAHPRHFTQWDDLVLVAAQEGDRIDVLHRREERLETLGEPIPVPSVACLAVRP